MWRVAFNSVRIISSVCSSTDWHAPTGGSVGPRTRLLRRQAESPRAQRPRQKLQEVFQMGDCAIYSPSAIDQGGNEGIWSYVPVPSNVMTKGQTEQKRKAVGEADIPKWPHLSKVCSIKDVPLLLGQKQLLWRSLRHPVILICEPG